MTDWFIFWLLAMAVARVTWLITEDHLPLVAKPRDWIVKRNPGGNLAYLVNCWFCSSVYVAAGAAAFAVWVLEWNWYVFGNFGEGHMDHWKVFLLMWPALSMAGVGIMGAIDWLTNAPDQE